MINLDNIATDSEKTRCKDTNDREVYYAYQKHRCGRFDEAYNVYIKVLRENPDHADALHYLGLLAQQSGKSEDAEKLVLRSLDAQPKNVEALNHLGQIYIALDRPQTAARCFRQAISFNPNHFNAINNLANCFRSAGSMETALLHYERAVAIEPNNPISVYNLGSTLKSLGRHWEAVAWLNKAARNQPDHFLAYHKLGECMEQLGRFAEAQEFYSKALSVKPDFHESLSALLSLPDYQCSDTDVDLARQALAKIDLDDDVRTSLEQSLGKYFDRQGEHDRAFTHFGACNDIQRASSAPFDIDAYVDRFDSYKDFYTEKRVKTLSAMGNPDERPIFVVGLPRTGTTLIEQVLSSHSTVHGAGELKEIQRAANRVALPVAKGGLGGFDAEPLQRGSIQYLAEEYLSVLAADAPAGAKRIVDKFPLNSLNLGLIAILFPNAKIIHCRRNPLDVAVSCFSVLFKMDNDFTNTLEDFGYFYNEYNQLMDYWYAALGPRIYSLEYESLVQDFAAQTRALVDYCDLSWEDGCLNFAKNNRAVRTPSKWQVRQGIYSSSINRWVHYEKQLAGLQKIIGSNA